ncbi:hypothetical protein N9U61_03610 [Acidimicrobiaceae bacterium]|nr:hypothetical protein [Acidimicrobiaceae bacterium]
MIKKRAFIRYTRYFSGVATTAISIFLINYYLDANEFAVWGVTNSLIYILSQLGQLTYVQYVEKYFPNLNDEEKKQTLYKFIKTTFVFFPVWFFVLVSLYFLNYFEKFNITNIVYLFFMITFSVIIESSIEIVSKYLLTRKDTISLDKIEFLYSKFFRLVLFTLLLINGFSIYHLLFTNIILRTYLFLRIINSDKLSLSDLFKEIQNVSIWDNNFTKIRYTFVAFGIKTLLIAFLNILFLFYSNFATSGSIAVATLGVLIVNNIGPVVASLTSLLSPMISENVNKSKKDTKLIGDFLFINSYSASLFITMSVTFVYTYNFFFNIEEFLGFNPDRVILLSILASTISSLYYPKLWHVKFSNSEIRLFKVIISIFTISVFFFLFLPINSDIFVYYIVFQILIYLVCFLLYKSEFPSFKNKFSLSFYISLVLVLISLSNQQYFLFQIFIYCIFCFRDYKNVRSLLDSKELSQ